LAADSGILALIARPKFEGVPAAKANVEASLYIALFRSREARELAHFIDRH